MRGERPSIPCKACAVICKVGTTLSNATASMALRNDRWMLTRTVRSSSLASIIRTGILLTGTPQWRAASA